MRNSKWERTRLKDSLDDDDDDDSDTRKNSTNKTSKPPHTKKTLPAPFSPRRAPGHGPADAAVRDPGDPPGPDDGERVRSFFFLFRSFLFFRFSLPLLRPRPPLTCPKGEKKLFSTAPSSSATPPPSPPSAPSPQPPGPTRRSWRGLPSSTRRRWPSPCRGRNSFSGFSGPCSCF